MSKQYPLREYSWKFLYSERAGGPPDLAVVSRAGSALVELRAVLVGCVGGLPSTLQLLVPLLPLSIIATSTTTTTTTTTTMIDGMTITIIIIILII